MVPVRRRAHIPPVMRVRDLSPAERPRERLKAAGPRALATRELMALVVGSGSAGRSALTVAAEIVAAAEGSLRRLGTLSAPALAAIPGVGKATAARIVAALELGRRAAAEEGSDGERIRGPADVHRRLGPRLRDLSHEEFHVLLLNVHHRILDEVLVTRGILDASVIHPREVFRPAILAAAHGIVLVHNHPSGDPEPSAEDRAVTRQLVEAGRAVGIQVLDHVVLGDGRFASFAEAGLL